MVLAWHSFNPIQTWGREEEGREGRGVHWTFFKRPKHQQKKEDTKALFAKSSATIAKPCTLAKRHAHWRPGPKNIEKPPHGLTGILKWPSIPKNWPQLRSWKHFNSKHLSPMEPEVVLTSMVLQYGTQLNQRAYIEFPSVHPKLMDLTFFRTFIFRPLAMHISSPTCLFVFYHH